jgi:hypothetical protein
MIQTFERIEEKRQRGKIYRMGDRPRCIILGASQVPNGACAPEDFVYRFQRSIQTSPNDRLKVQAAFVVANQLFKMKALVSESFPSPTKYRDSLRQGFNVIAIKGELIAVCGH